MSTHTATRMATAVLLTPPILALAVTLAACAAPATPPESGQGPAGEAVPTEAGAAPGTETDSVPTDEAGPTSSVEVPLLVTTAAPCAIASATGRPNPSRSLG